MRSATPPLPTLHTHADKMKTTAFLLLLAAAGSLAATAAAAQPTDPTTASIPLPPPSKDAMTLGAALEKRATAREFAPRELSEQELSDLLWAANGFNRPDAKKRTAPTAMNRQEIDLYLLRRDGAWLWDADGNRLQRVSGADLRGLTGRSGAGADNFALAAPLTLLYVVDYKRQKMQSRPQDAFKYACVDIGFIGQNVYLHCAAAGLNTVFLGSLKPDELAKALALPETSVPIFAQTIGKAPQP